MTSIKIHVPHLIAEIGDEQRRAEDGKRLHEWLVYIGQFVSDWGRAYHMQTSGEDVTAAAECRKRDCRSFRRLADYVRALDDPQAIQRMSEEDDAEYVSDVDVQRVN